MEISRRVAWLGLLLAVRVGHAQSSFPNVQVSVAADLVQTMSLESNATDENRLELRSGELLFYAPIDHLFDGTLNLAAHTEEGKVNFEIHEGYIGSSKLIPRSRFRVGKFFLGVGRLNQFHQHDWPFTSAPKVQSKFFADEGAADTGYEYSILLPTPFFLDVTFGLTNGYCYGHCHDLGERPRTPVHYIRPATYFDLGPSTGLMVGLNYLGRTNSKGVRTTLIGTDITLKERQGKRLRWLWQSEVWNQEVENPTSMGTSTVGAYTYPQYGVDETLFVGCRLDGYSVLNQKFENGGRQLNFSYGIVPVITYKASEFSTLRASYTHAVDTAERESDATDRRFEVQLTYLLGAHPAHDF